MSIDKASLSIVILNKEYRIACKDSERAELLESADYLNERIEALQRKHVVATPERLMLMLALNLSNELLRKDAQGGQDDPHLRGRISALCELVDNVLEEGSDTPERLASRA